MSAALLAGACVLSLVAACTSAGGSDGPTIDHIPVTADQAAGVAVTIEARVTDPDGVASVLVFYQAPHAGSWNSASLTLDITRADTYTGAIPAEAVVAPSVSYYLEAQDRKGNTSRSPDSAPASAYTFTVGGGGDDTHGPAISHVKIADNRPMGSQVTVSATVTDDTGVASVTCQYRAVGATDWIPLAMPAVGNNKYQADFPVAAIVPPAVEYYLEAVDTAPAANRSVLPTNAPDSPFTFTVSPGDQDPPVITHTPLADGQPEGRPAAVVARVEDATGVASVTLYYRTHGATTWDQVAMTQADAASPFTGIIPEATVTSDGVDYYIEAVDSAPLANTAFAPDTAPATPYTFTTAPETCIAPPLAAESFEAGIFPGWWRTYSSGTGCEWTVSSSYGHDGSHSASHSYGYSCSDLLVLPCLDLTGLESEGLVLDFWQRSSSLSSYEIHTLEWAENVPDPASSTYTVVGSPIPEESASSTWGYRKITIPPGAAMLGKSKVYFAFRYNGDDEYTWYLDEIRARRPGPNIELSSLTANPNPVNPGAASVDLTVTLRNSGDAASPALTGTLSTTDSGITINTAGASFPGVAAGGETTSSTSFNLSVSSGHASAVDAPLKLHVDDGTRTYDLDLALYIGARATAHIVMNTSGGTWESDTELYLGVGADTGSPEWLGTQIPYSATDPDTSGTFTYDVDLTAQAAYLPPTLQHPFFLKAVNHYSGPLTIQQFTIAYGAASFTAVGLPWQAGTSDYSSPPAVSYLFVPSPPRFVVEGVPTTTPSPLAPGTSGATLSITVRNLGSATQGALDGVLTLKAPTTATDVTGLTPSTPISFATGPIGNNGTATGASTWTFDVTAAHNDGSPLHFNLALTDATSGLVFNVPVDVAVPWPGVSVLSWSTSGATGNGNYLPDPGETVDLIVTIQNTGTGATAGQVSGVLSVNADTTGLATVTSGMDSSTFGSGPLGEGATATSATTYRIVISSSAHAHETLHFDLTLTDGTNVWVKPLLLPLYEQWGGTDPSGDASGVVDLRYAYFNCDNTTLEVRSVANSSYSATSATVSLVVADPASGPGHAVRLTFDGGTLYAETLGAGTWQTATVPASFTATPAAATSTTLVFRVSLADLATLGLTLPKQARLGLETFDSYGYGDDYLPDAWSSGNISDLVTVSWP